MYAIVKAGGRQEKVSVGETLVVDRIDAAVGSSVTFPAVLLVDGADVTADPKALSSVMPNMQGVTWVPVRSTINVTVQPLYSREQVRQFSLDSFVKGEYVFKGSGYL